jgi:hypothetical protein
MPAAPPINMTIHNSGKSFTLLEPLCYAGAIGTITVPAGYVTDCASVPRAIWSIIPPLGRYQYAAIIHDWLYDTHHADIHALSRAACDKLFLDIMQATDVGWRTRSVMYYAVRLFGGRIWRAECSLHKRIEIVNLCTHHGGIVPAMEL